MSFHPDKEQERIRREFVITEEGFYQMERMSYELSISREEVVSTAIIYGGELYERAFRGDEIFSCHEDRDPKRISIFPEEESWKEEGVHFSNPENIEISLPKEIDEQIDRVANLFNLNRSEVVDSCLNLFAYLEDEIFQGREIFIKSNLPEEEIESFIVPDNHGATIASVEEFLKSQK